MALLETQKLTKTFIGLKAVTNLDLSVNKGQFLGLIGPNGAGKTTAFNLISGTPVTSGKVIFKGKDITGCKPPHHRAVRDCSYFSISHGFSGFVCIG